MRIINTHSAFAILLYLATFIQHFNDLCLWISKTDLTNFADDKKYYS